MKIILKAQCVTWRQNLQFPDSVYLKYIPKIFGNSDEKSNMTKLPYLIFGLLIFHISCWAEEAKYNQIFNDNSLELTEEALGGEPLFESGDSLAKTLGLDTLTISDSLDYHKVMHDSSIYLSDIQGLGGLSSQGLSEEDFYSTPLVNGQAAKKKVPWNVEEKSLWENATSLDDIFKKKGETNADPKDQGFASLALDNNLNLFSENKRDVVKAFYLWDEDEPKAKSDSELLPWGWSLDQPNGAQKSKKSSWFD